MAVPVALSVALDFETDRLTVVWNIACTAEPFGVAIVRDPKGIDHNIDNAQAAIVSGDGTTTHVYQMTHATSVLGSGTFCSIDTGFVANGVDTNGGEFFSGGSSITWNAPEVTLSPNGVDPTSGTVSFPNSPSGPIRVMRFTPATSGTFTITPSGTVVGGNKCRLQVFRRSTGASMGNETLDLPYSFTCVGGVEYLCYFRRNGNGGGVSQTYAATYTAPVSLPDQVTTPSPANNATDVEIGITLSWAAASGATAYDVYLEEGANPPTVLVSNDQVGTTYFTGPLTPNVRYYWRIDSVNGGGTTTGEVWSFVTEPKPPATHTGLSIMIGLHL